MGLGSSFATAISGLEAHGQMLSTITDNIVNANTVGFKGSRTEFQTILAQDMSGNAVNQIGRGVNVAGTTMLLNQGSITNTGRNTDLALNGNGFFIIRSENRGNTYTRDGQFRFDKEGWLTNVNGYRVQAYQATPDGVISGKLGDIRLPYNTIPAKATKTIELHLNLDARLPLGRELDVTRPAETSQFATSLQIFDSIGVAHGLNVFFNKTQDNVWEFNAMTDGSELQGGTPGQLETVLQGSLRFDEIGRLQGVDQNVVNNNFANGAVPDQELRFNFGDALEEMGTGQKGTTAFGSKGATFRSVQDGWAAGVLSDCNVDENGVITGIYTNGINKTLGQMAVARFEATERLARLGENQFRETVASGQPMIGMANTNGRGSIMPTSVELSNVDLAKEFVDMIKAQRGFQASAKGITTANEMLDDVINLKRA